MSNAMGALFAPFPDERKPEQSNAALRALLQEMEASKPQSQRTVAQAMMGALDKVGAAARSARQYTDPMQYISPTTVAGFLPGAGIVQGYDDFGRGRDALKAGRYKDAALDYGAGLLNAATDMVPMLAALPPIMRETVEFSHKVGYPTPSRPPRPFEADYPKGAVADDAGRLKQTIDGDEIRAKYLVGRQVHGGEDAALPQAEYDAITKALTGNNFVVVAPSAIDKASGAFETARDPVTGDIVRQVLLNRDLTEAEVPRVLAHEIGHAIESRAGDVTGYINGLPSRQIPIKTPTKTGQVYHELNTSPKDWRAEQYGGTENIPKKYWAKPSEQIYKTEVKRQKEYIAEALRAYMENPNYIKTVAPEMAKEIRKYVNKHPQISEIIQFNSLVPLLPAAGLGLLASGDQD